MSRDTALIAASTRDALVELHAGTVVRWKARAVEEATTALAPIFDPLIGPKEVRSSWQGSECCVLNHTGND